MGHFASKQSQIKILISGEALQVNEDGCKDMAGNFVVRFSKKFQQTIIAQNKAGYKLSSAGEVNFIVYWLDEEGVEVRVVLPEVGFTEVDLREIMQAELVGGIISIALSL